jgi:catechol 2,3-dioxygenase-like lactoylglutathione lyase family enzyme
MSQHDLRPPVWIGHVQLSTDRLDESETFMRTIGMRPIVKRQDLAVLELRGGTHLVLRAQAEVVPGPAPFDLMVEDIDATHQYFTQLGLAPSAIEAGRIHRWFQVREPAGHTITVNSTHVSDQPV